MAIRFLTLFMIVQTCALIGINAFASEDFEIGAGDTILIDVYNEKDLYVRARIGKNGTLKFPLIGIISVSGKTTKQLEVELEAALFDGYLVDPDVSVAIESFRPFYIKGAIKSAGAYEFKFDLTVDQAIAVAGGLKDRASKKDWYIIRGSEKIRSKATKETIVMPGDIIEIEESIF